MSVRRLDEVCEVVMGQAPAGEAYNDKGIGWALLAGAGDFDDGLPKPKKFTSVASKLSQSGDVIIGIRASIGEKVWSDGIYCLGRGVAALRAGSELDRRFLWNWMSYATPELASKGKGATFKQVNRSDIAELAIPVLPLVEQRRIAAILDQAETLRTKRRQALAHLDSLTQSIFLDMFGDPVTNPNGWAVKAISSLGKVVTGNTPSRDVPEYYGNSVEWIKSDNVNTPHYYLTKATEGLSEAGKVVGRVVPPKSILVTCIAGSPDCIGNAAMADREVAFNQQINAFIPVELDAQFAYAQIVVGKKLIQGASTNGMKGMVSKSRFEAIEFMAPPPALQRTFATRIQAIEGLKATHRAALAELDALFASLQQRAFIGELTPSTSPVQVVHTKALDFSELCKLDADKGLEALIYVARRMPEHHFYKSLKALYFADKHQLEHQGRLIYGETHCALPMGPVPQAAYDAAKVLSGELLVSAFDDEALRASLRRTEKELIPLRDADPAKLSAEERASLDWAIRYLAPMSFDQVKTASHDSAYERTPRNQPIQLEHIVEMLPEAAKRRFFD